MWLWKNWRCTKLCFQSFKTLRYNRRC